MMIGNLTKIVYIIISLFVFLLFSTVIGVCDECVKGNCVNGYGTMRTRGGVVKGIFKNGKLNGKGVLKTFEGDIYEGHFLDNTFDGYGVLRNIDSSIVYKGQHKKGVSHGSGTLENKKMGMTYTGEWYNGLFIKGTWQKYDGTKYVGELKNMKFHGKGVLTLPDGKKYSGRWANGEFLGK